MAKNQQDELARAYAMLKSLRSNIGQMATNLVPETYFREFHTVLDRLEAIKIDVSDFRIQDSEVKPKITSLPTSHSRGGGGGGESYVSNSKEKYVERSFILTKLDAILGYFEIITSEKPREMGFRTLGKK